MTKSATIRLIPLAIMVLGMTIGLLGCRNNTKRIENQAVLTDSVRTADDGTGRQKTIVDSVFQVHIMSAIFYVPDSLQLDSIKKIYKEHYPGLLDDTKRSQNQAMEFLKNKNIRIFTTNKIYLQFEHPTGEPYNYNRKELKRTWGLLLYDHDNPPRDVDMNMVEYEYLQYFVK